MRRTANTGRGDRLTARGPAGAAGARLHRPTVDPNRVAACLRGDTVDPNRVAARLRGDIGTLHAEKALDRALPTFLATAAALLTARAGIALRAAVAQLLLLVLLVVAASSRRGGAVGGRALTASAEPARDRTVHRVRHDRIGLRSSRKIIRDGRAAVAAAVVAATRAQARPGRRRCRWSGWSRSGHITACGASRGMQAVDGAGRLPKGAMPPHAGAGAVAPVRRRGIEAMGIGRIRHRPTHGTCGRPRAHGRSRGSRRPRCRRAGSRPIRVRAPVARLGGHRPSTGMRSRVRSHGGSIRGRKRRTGYERSRGDHGHPALRGQPHKPGGSSSRCQLGDSL